MRLPVKVVEEGKVTRGGGGSAEEVTCKGGEGR